MIIATKELQRGLGLVQGAAERKMAIPILGTVRLTGEGDGLTLTATDLDTTIQTRVPTKGGQFDLCLPAKKLFEIARLLNADEAEIEATGNDRAVLKSGKAKFTLAGTPADQFPAFVFPASGGLSLDGTQFATAVRRVRHAITNEPGRFLLAGAKFEFFLNKARLVTTDGHRLALAEFDVPDAAPDKEADLLIPRKALTEAARLFDGGPFDLTYDQNSVAFSAPDLLLSARKMTGTFPAYDNILPQNTKCSAVFAVDEAVKVLRRASVLADDKVNRANLSACPDEIHIAVRDGQGNEAREAFPAKCAGIGESVDAAFNVDYLLDALTSSNAETVTVRFDTGESPWMFAVEDGRWKAVVMPQRF